MKITWLLVSIGCIILLGLCAGYFLAPRFINHTTVALVSVGSGNVFAFLEDRVPKFSRSNPLWLDIGSISAQEIATTAFNYGEFTFSERRVGFIALSSSGFSGLEKPQDGKSSGNSQEHNYWLSIKLGSPPVSILYRGVQDDAFSKSLEMRETGDDKQQGPQHYYTVRFTALKTLIESPSVAFKRFLPEADTGTRHVLSGPGLPTINWPKFDADKGISQVPDYFDEVKSQEPFMEILSYPQVQDSGHPPDCPLLAKSHIKAAAICNGDDTPCKGEIPTDYRLIIKVSKNPDSKGGAYLIRNNSECTVAESLVGDITHCTLEGTQDTTTTHVIEKTADLLEPQPIPTYLTCSSNRPDKVPSK